MKPAQEISIQLDKYELLTVLGHGGMATVYRARDRRWGVTSRSRSFTDTCATTTNSHSIRTRGRAVAKLHHPNIVEVSTSRNRMNPKGIWSSSS